MFDIKRLILFNAITSIHIGSGSKLGVIDQPVQREVHTNFPIFPSSSIKGGFREEVEGPKTEERLKHANIIFGSDEGGNRSTPGNITFTDAKILFLPVKSLFGVFAWITSPLVLTRFKEDLKILGTNEFCDFNYEKDKVIKDNKFLTIKDNSLSKNSKITLEDFTFDTENTEGLNNLLNLISGIFSEDEFKEKFRKDVVIVNDEVFKYFIENSLEFLPRIRIGEGETASGKGGNIWYEENIPSYTIFYSLVMYNNKEVKINDEIIKTCNLINSYINNGYLQLGGNQTIGRGILKYKVF